MLPPGAMALIEQQAHAVPTLLSKGVPIEPSVER
jgi:hypothetical protein